MKSVRELIVRLAKENVGWGVRRIVGELKKLALRTSRSTVRRVLVEEKILPDPDRRTPNLLLQPTTDRDHHRRLTTRRRDDDTRIVVPTAQGVIDGADRLGLIRTKRNRHEIPLVFSENNTYTL